VEFEAVLSMLIRLFTISRRARIVETIRSLLALNSALMIQGEARGVREALAECLIHKPDVFIYDFDPSLSDHHENITRLRAGGRHIHILILHDRISVEHSRLVLQAGADGLVASDADPLDLSQMVNALHAGKSVIPLSLLSALLD
jgi:DNA-binding NarL/FixJ family response regulator